MASEGEIRPWGKRPRCPLCGRPRDEQWRPFCSKRCADLDLGRWLGEAYRVPATEEPDEDEDTPHSDGRPE